MYPSYHFAHVLGRRWAQGSRSCFDRVEPVRLGTCPIQPSLHLYPNLGRAARARRGYPPCVDLCYNGSELVGSDGQGCLLRRSRKVSVEGEACLGPLIDRR